MIGLIIFFIIALGIIVIGIVSASKDGKNVQMALMILALAFTITVLSIVTYHEGYKQATIDLQTGHTPIYELITNPDSTKEWKLKK